MNTNDSEWDKIEVEEMQELLAKINDFMKQGITLIITLIGFLI